MSRSAAALTRLLCLLSMTLACLTPSAKAQETDPAKLWDDFSHYVLIARPDIAADAGKQLLETADADALLAAVEASTYKPERVLPKARLVDDSTLPGVAAALEAAIQQARIKHSRDPQRIAADIELLAQGDRAYVNAVQRLKAAGQYAAPQMLDTLLNPAKKELHPFVMTAMVAIGEDLSYPLSVALPKLDAVPMTQVAQVLAQIGYPTPLPYLKQTLESPTTDAEARKAVESAFNTLMAETNLSPGLSAAGLYTAMAEKHYRAGSARELVTGYDRATEQGIIWSYQVKPEASLVPIPVPGPIYADARALRDAKSALQLDPTQDQALSLYLAANLRRENRLPEGAADPSYQESQPASFYAMLAGPERLHDVLTMALNDGDAPLALDTIEALSGTAGTDALTTTRTSLVRGLTYPDRRVRFRSAEALAAAKPAGAYEGSYNVVRILGDQVRQNDKLYAVVLADDQDTVNLLLAAMNDLGYEAFGSTRVGDLSGQINERPGIDMVVIHQGKDAVSRFVTASNSDFKLNATPVLALVSEGDQVRLKSEFADTPRVLPVLRTTKTDELKPAVEAARARVAGAPIDDAESLEFSLTALALLRDLAISASSVYDVLEAQPAIEQALTDDRDPVVVSAGQVLALFNNASAQQALIESAFKTEGDVQIALLDSLAASAQHYGNLCSAAQTDRLLELVQSSAGPTAIAAAKAHGSLKLSTPNAVKLIAAN